MKKHALLILLGAAGTFNGVSLTSDPSGRSLGLNVGMLPSWHTWDYRYAGAFVLFALGIAPLVCAAAVIVDVAGSRMFAGVVGAVAVGWAVWQWAVLDVWAPRAFLGLVVIGAVLALGAIDSVRHRSENR